MAIGLALAGSRAAAQEEAPLRRGPLEARDEWLLAQTRLTLPATSPDPLPRGETRIRLDVDWGNDFGFEGRTTPPQRLGFLVDGEHRSAALDVRYGFRSSVVLGARLPVRWRGAGVLDGVIDAWHRTTGLPDNHRSNFPGRFLRVAGSDDRARPFQWTGSEGAGLGDLELLAHWAFRVPRASGWTAAAVGRVALPTGTGPFRASGVDAGAQLVAAHPLGRAVDVYLGVGGTVFSELERDGLSYARFRPQGFATLEWRPTRRLSLLAEVSAAGALLTDIPAYTGRHIQLRAGARRDFGRDLELSAGFVEGASSVQSTTDFGVVLAVTRTLRSRRP
jgi:hypothetical protein